MHGKNKVCVITDTNSGITSKQGKKLGIGIVPMPFFIDGEEYFEHVNLSHEEFYDFMKRGCDVKTAQPSLVDLGNIFKEKLKNSEEVVYIPMSSSLSGCVETAKWISKEEFDGKVHVVDNKRISCTQKQSVLEAVKMAEKGFSAYEIKKVLEKHSMDASIYLSVNTLEYLKKGGRITSAGAAIATILGIKPILQIQGGKIDAYSKTRGIQMAKKSLLKAIEQDANNRFAGKKVIIKGAYTGDKNLCSTWKKDIEEYFPNQKVSVDPLSLSIACHIGPGALGIVCIPEIEEAENVNYEI